MGEERRLAGGEAQLLLGTIVRRLPRGGAPPRVTSMRTRDSIAHASSADGCSHYGILLKEWEVAGSRGSWRTMKGRGGRGEEGRGEEARRSRREVTEGGGRRFASSTLQTGSSGVSRPSPRSRSRHGARVPRSTLPVYSVRRSSSPGGCQQWWITHEPRLIRPHNTAGDGYRPAAAVSSSPRPANLLLCANHPTFSLIFATVCRIF